MQDPAAPLQEARHHELGGQAQQAQDSGAVVGAAPATTVADAGLQAQFMPPRYLQLNVLAGVGAGLSLRPSSWGMLVEEVDAQPGQPGLVAGDYIVEISGRSLVGLDADATKEAFGRGFGHGASIAVAQLNEDPVGRRHDRFPSSGSWPEAVEVAGDPWPEAAEVEPQAAIGRGWAASSPVAANGYPASRGAESAGGSEPPSSGLMELVAQLSQQLANETLRRDAEEQELEERRKDDARLREELQAKRQRRADVIAATEGAARAAEETRRQHSELAVAHERTKQEVATHEASLSELREAARAKNGRDWARDGPEKDALVETKLSIAEAHDRLAHIQLQLRLNRDGLRRQLHELQAENCRLRANQNGAATRA